jgi:hypothetical protein
LTGDYIYWNSTTATWVVGSQQIQLGGNAGKVGQAAGAVAVGFNAGSSGQRPQSIAIGQNAGQTGQGGNAFSLGNAVAIGQNAGSFNQNEFSIAIGIRAGQTAQGGVFGGAIAIGKNAGSNNQGQETICIGTYTNVTDPTLGGQDLRAIAIGTDAIDEATVQVAGSIVLNGTGSAINTNEASTIGSTVGGLYVAPIQPTATAFTTVLGYDTTTKQVVYSTTGKSFIIDHPLDPDNKYLVHCCLEGPESGVYYRGKSEIVNGTSAEIQLPSYVGVLCTDLTVQITHIYDGAVKAFSASEVDTATNTFTVHGENGRFNWLVHGKRSDVTAEVNKADVTVCGDGPYKYFA